MPGAVREEEAATTGGEVSGRVSEGLRGQNGLARVLASLRQVRGTETAELRATTCTAAEVDAAATLAVSHAANTPVLDFPVTASGNPGGSPAAGRKLLCKRPPKLSRRPFPVFLTPAHGTPVVVRAVRRTGFVEFDGRTTTSVDRAFFVSRLPTVWSFQRFGPSSIVPSLTIVVGSPVQDQLGGRGPCGLPGVHASDRSIGGAPANENHWGVADEDTGGRVRSGSGLPNSAAGKGAFPIEGRRSVRTRESRPNGWSARVRIRCRAHSFWERFVGRSDLISASMCW